MKIRKVVAFVVVLFSVQITSLEAQTITEIIDATGVERARRVKDLTEAEISKLSGEISQTYKVEGDLRREIQQHIRRLIDIGSYRGMRHRRNLPVRGQRTKTNARTRRGRRKTVGASKSGSKGAAPAPQAS